MIQRSDLDHKYLGTCFDRQVRIDLWNQDKLKEQTILILGVGGLGSVVLMNVLRLGVKKVIIVDYDVVDVHNLNRQIMYGLEDVGKPKVESALKNCKHHNVGGSEVEGYHLDAVKNWNKIIEFAKESNVVFNCIDYGDKYDIAVSSLCMALKLPLIMGGTFATMFTVDYIHFEGRACFLCMGDEGKINKQLVEKISPDKILDYQSLQFLPKNNNPTGRSSMMVCLMCGQLMVSHYVNYLFLSEDRPYKTTRLIGYHNTFEIIKFDGEVDKKCLYCGDPNYVEPPKVQENAKNQISDKKEVLKQAVEVNQETKVEVKLESQQKNQESASATQIKNTVTIQQSKQEPTLEIKQDVSEQKNLQEAEK